MIRNAWPSIRRTTVVVGGSSMIMIGFVEYTTHVPSQRARSSQVYHFVSDKIATPILRKTCDPEVAHNLALQLAQAGLAVRHRSCSLEQQLSLESTLTYDTPSSKSNTKQHTLIFPNPIGLAAGFDKDGIAISALLEMGFGSVEIGSVTPKAQPGNPKPRMFRLVEDKALINRYGFNSQGANIVEENLKSFRRAQTENATLSEQPTSPLLNSFLSWILPPVQPKAKGLLGINIGKNKTTQDAKVDYVQNIQQLGPYADYLVINISSPNTPNLRDLQKADALSELVQACLNARNALPKPVPLLVKISPDLTDAELQSMIPTLHKVDGVVVTNTTNARPASLVSTNQNEIGGLSGAPLKDKSTEMIRKLYAWTKGRVFIIGVGGVGSGQDAYEKFKAGASIVQIYSMMIYEGPGVVSRIRQDVALLMKQDGYTSLSKDVIGRDHEQEVFWKQQRRQ